MSEYYDGGSMRGSGIDSIEVEYDVFQCNDCEFDNPEGVVNTDDWGNYEVTCSECGWLYTEGKRWAYYGS